MQREEIYQRVWGYAMVHGDRSVDVFVRKLRQKLEKVSPGWRYIHTHFGIGYRFAAEPADGPVVEAPLPVPVPVAGPRRSRPRPGRGRAGTVGARARAGRRSAPEAARAIVSVVGPDRNTHLRNAGIVLLLAVAVWQLPGGDTAADVDRQRPGHRVRRGARLLRLQDVHGEPVLAVHARGQGARAALRLSPWRWRS